MPFSDAIRIGASGAADSYKIDRSLRFSGADQTRLNYTPASGGNKRTYTFSWWLKRGTIDRRMLFGSFNSGATVAAIELQDDHKLAYYDYDSGYRIQFQSNQLFRDPSAWYHFVIATDTTQSTESNRVKIYVNGSQITDWATSTYPSQNFEGLFNNNTLQHAIGTEGANQRLHFDGYMADVYFLDGYAYDPSYFGETNATTGQWIPKEYTGSFGNNGYYLKFSDNSGTSATTLGKDSSGNGNNVTPVNFSVSAGASNDSLEDTPTNNFCTINPLAAGRLNIFPDVSNGNLDFNISSSFKNPASSFQIPASGKWYAEYVFTTVGSGVVNVGNLDKAQGSSAAEKLNGISLLSGEIRVNDSATQTSLTAFGANDIIGVKVDRDAGTVAFTINGSAVGSAENISSMNAPTDLIFRAYRNSSGGSAPVGSVNFGQRPFSYLPAGFKALNSANIPVPTILLPNKHFETLLYTGNGGSHSVTGLQFQPDWLWIKNRGQTDNHQLHDAVRGPSKGLHSNLTNAEFTDANAVTAFNSNGFSMNNNYDSHNKSSETYVAWNWDAGETDSATYTVKVVSDSGNKYRFNDFGTSAVTLDLAEGGTYTFDQSDSSMSPHPMLLSTTANGHHGGGSTYNTGVTYQLDGSSVNESAFVSGFSSASSRKLIITVAASAPNLNYFCHYHSGMGGAINTNSTLGSSNFDGTLQATVKANTTSGFSIVTWTGNGSSGATIGHGLGVAPKSAFVKNRSSSTNWPAVLFDLQTGGQLNTSQAFSNGNYNAYFAGQPSSSVLTLGSHSTTNTNGDNYVAYVFSEVSSYNKFASYTGNGNANGTFVNTGFRPAWVLISNSNAGFDWVLQDSTRSPSNVANKKLNPNQNAAEQSNYDKIDILSNGFKPRVSDAGVNADGSVYYYWAFAEFPFKNSRAR